MGLDVEIEVQIAAAACPWLQVPLFLETQL